MLLEMAYTPYTGLPGVIGLSDEAADGVLVTTSDTDISAVVVI